MNERVPAGHGRREDRRLQEREHDPYASRTKLAEPSVCGRCGAVYHAGRWSWHPRPNAAEEVICPACRRISDDYPAGTLVFSGGFLRKHREEIESTIRRAADSETREHPMNRLIDLRWHRGQLTGRTTDVHTPRRIGQAVQHAFQGDLSLDYAPAETFVRVGWHRDG